MAIQLGLSDEEARRRFGSDFRNLTEQRSGQRGLFESPSLSSKELFTGFGRENFPNITGNIQQRIAETNREGLASSSLGSEFAEIQRKQEEKNEQQRRFQEKRTAIRGQFDVERGLTERRFASRQSLATQQGGIQGGSGSGLARSSTQEAGNVLREEALTRSLKELKIAEEAAVQSGDESLFQRIKEERAQIHKEDLELRQEARAERAQLIQQRQFNKTLGLSEDRFEFEQQQGAIANTLAIAGLTGEFEGAKTAAEKTRIANKAFEEAKLQGVFEGEPTLAKLSFQEVLRSNLAQEALQAQVNAISAAKGTGGVKVNDFIQAFRTIQRIPVITSEEAQTQSGIVQDEQETLLQDLLGEAISILSSSEYNDFLRIVKPELTAPITQDLVQRPEGLFSLSQQRFLTPKEVQNIEIPLLQALQPLR